VTGSWCHFCHRLKDNIINPLIIKTNLENYAEFREVILDKHGWRLKNFDGRLIEMPQFAKTTLKTTFTPTTLFLDAHGNTIADPIVGLTLEEYYPHYLEEGINHSLKKLGNSHQLDINNLTFNQ